MLLAGNVVTIESTQGKINRRVKQSIFISSLCNVANETHFQFSLLFWLLFQIRRQFVFRAKILETTRENTERDIPTSAWQHTEYPAETIHTPLTNYHRTRFAVSLNERTMQGFVRIRIRHVRVFLCPPARHPAYPLSRVSTEAETIPIDKEDWVQLQDQREAGGE